MPASSRMDFLPLARTKPIRSNSNAPVIIYLKTEGIEQKEFQPGKSRVRTMNNNADTKVSAEGGAGGAPGTRAEAPAARGADHGGAAVPLQPREDHGGAETPLQPMEEPMLEQVDA
ncbi:hypothetical protein BTVI_58355 [Pitangus sulphuratus]|nr:hypothetical protein BTVI_58355 [Pitangus sulphuratus]